jgi:hypothetical protein
VGDHFLEELILVSLPIAQFILVLKESRSPTSANPKSNGAIQTTVLTGPTIAVNGCLIHCLLLFIHYTSIIAKNGYICQLEFGVVFQQQNGMTILKHTQGKVQALQKVQPRPVTSV